MNNNSINNPSHSKKRLVFALRGIIGIIFLAGTLFFLINIFSTEQSLLSLNTFLSNWYGYFFIFRIFLYIAVILMCLKMKKKIKPTSYYRVFVRTGYACIIFVFLNEVMLYIRLMG